MIVLDLEALEYIVQLLWL